MIEQLASVKAAALRDDDNVFDVAYERQGAEGDAATVSATDIKAWGEWWGVRWGVGSGGG